MAGYPSTLPAKISHPCLQFILAFLQKSERRADYSAGAHYADEQDTSTAILFPKILALIPTIRNNSVP